MSTSQAVLQIYIGILNTIITIYTYTENIIGSAQDMLQIVIGACPSSIKISETQIIRYIVEHVITIMKQWIAFMMEELGICAPF